MWNIFSTAGGIVAGDRFVGREDDLRRLAARLLDPAEPQSTSVTGLPRMGKSSLAWRVLMDPESGLQRRDRVVVWSNVATLSADSDPLLELFRLIVRDVLSQVPGDLAYRLAGDAETVSTLSAGSTVVEKFESFVRELRRADLRLIVVLDNFDRARTVFSGNYRAFAYLLQLGSEPDKRIAWVTASRRPLHAIVRSAITADSAFPSIFDGVTLGCFSRSEFDSLACRTPPDLALGSVHDFIYEQSGGHPLLATLMLSRAAELALDGANCSGQMVLRRSLSKLVEEYDHVIRLLDEDDTLDQLLQVVFGPVVGVSRFDAERLVDSGIARVSGDTYDVFSPHFRAYLEVKARERDLWPLWSAAERSLRLLILRVLGSNWEERLLEDNAKMTGFIAGLRERRDREHRNFGRAASNELLDFTYPMDLFSVMRIYWTEFESVLGQSTAYWRERFELLARVRAPLAHNRTITRSAGDRAEEICTEIVSLIGNQAD